MSDFDKEAEREKLREQFADDEDEREATERMSNLLLQGATMTNTHCDTCSSPIFTYQGQSFCPTCQVEVDTGRGTAAGDIAESNADSERPDSAVSPEGGDPTAHGEREVADDSSARIEVNDPETGTDRPSTSVEPEASPESGSEPDTARDVSPAAASAPTAEPARTRTDAGDGTDAVGDTGTDDADLAAAQTSLSRTLTRLSRAAERSEDLSRTREYLQGAREAADALAALKQARR